MNEIVKKGPKLLKDSFRHLWATCSSLMFVCSESKHDYQLQMKDINNKMFNDFLSLLNHQLDSGWYEQMTDEREKMIKSLEIQNEKEKV